MAKKKQPPEIVDMLLLAKFSDGKIRQVIVNKYNQLNIAYLLRRSSIDDKISVLENEVDGISWSSDIDLRENSISGT